MPCPVEVGDGVGVSPVSAVGTASDSADATLTDGTDVNGPAKDIDSSKSAVTQSKFACRDQGNCRLIVFSCQPVDVEGPRPRLHGRDRS